PPHRTLCAHASPPQPTPLHPDPPHPHTHPPPPPPPIPHPHVAAPSHAPALPEHGQRRRHERPHPARRGDSGRGRHPPSEHAPIVRSQLVGVEGGRAHPPPGAPRRQRDRDRGTRCGECPPDFATAHLQGDRRRPGTRRPDDRHRHGSVGHPHRAHPPVRRHFGGRGQREHADAPRHVRPARSQRRALEIAHYVHLASLERFRVHEARRVAHRGREV